MPENHLYEYAVVRYVPRVEREEFINIGLVMMCKRQKWLRVRLHLDEEKLRVFASPASREEIETQLGTFRRLAEGTDRQDPMASLPVEERFRWLTAEKSASIATSRPHPGQTPDLEETFNTLFTELVL